MVVSGVGGRGGESTDDPKDGPSLACEDVGLEPHRDIRAKRRGPRGC